jgi:hypothetical protein
MRISAGSIWEIMICCDKEGCSSQSSIILEDNLVSVAMVCCLGWNWYKYKAAKYVTPLSCKGQFR